MNCPGTFSGAIRRLKRLGCCILKPNVHFVGEIHRVF